MIEMDIATALFFYLLFTAGLTLVVWSFFEKGTTLKSFNPEERYIWHCSICSNNYIDSRHDEISKCPRCGSFNQRVTDDAKDIFKNGEKR